MYAYFPYIKIIIRDDANELRNKKIGYGRYKTLGLTYLSDHYIVI